MKRQSSDVFLDPAVGSDSAEGEPPHSASCSISTSEEESHDVIASPVFKRQASSILSIQKSTARCNNCFGLGRYVEGTLDQQEHEGQRDPPRNQAGSRTGLVFASSPDHYDISNPLHRERQQRITSIVEALERAGLLDRCVVLHRSPLSTVGESASDGPANLSLSSLEMQLTEEDFARVHRLAYLRRLERLSTLTSDGDLILEAEQYESVYLTTRSYEHAKQATDALCALVRRVITGELRNGFAAIRPPGHHAEPSVAGGYCLVNHVAVAARYAQALSQELSASAPNKSTAEATLHRVKLVLIVDWDVHHGNGTQSIFENDPTVLYFSVHRWHSGQYYPFQSRGGPMRVSLCRCPHTGDQVTRHVYVGWTQKGMGDDEYRAVWRLLLMPMAREFQPDLVLVSAGFDAADGDIGDCHVTPGCFAFLTKQLQSLAGGRVVCSLEGGYIRSVLTRCVAGVVEALLEDDGGGSGDEGRDCDPEIVLRSIDPVGGNDIRSTIAAHQAYWKCLQVERHL